MNRTASEAGFSLVELIVVVVLLGVLAGGGGLLILQPIEAYDAQVHILVDFSHFDRVDPLPQVVPGAEGDWRMEPAESSLPTLPEAKSTILRRVSKIQVEPTDMLPFWLFLMGAGK